MKIKEKWQKNNDAMDPDLVRIIIGSRFGPNLSRVGPNTAYDWVLLSYSFFGITHYAFMIGLVFGALFYEKAHKINLNFVFSYIV